MKKRQFLKVGFTSAIGCLILPVNIFAKKHGHYDFDALFPRYTEFDPKVPVWNVTPDMNRVIHRFYDTSPISPSGRYLGIFRLPFEDRRPNPGEIGEVVLVDLYTGKTKTVAESKGWDTQLGAQVQWGATDEELFFNDMDTSIWIPFGIKMNPLTGEKKNL